MPAENEGYRQHGDAGARAEEQIGRRCGGGAGGEDFRASDPLRRRGDRNLQPGHHAGVKRPQYADRGVAQGELHLPQRQQHIERVGKAVMQRMGTTGDPKYARLVASRLDCVESAVIVMTRCHRRGIRVVTSLIWQYDGLMTNDLF